MPNPLCYLVAFHHLLLLLFSPAVMNSEEMLRWFVLAFCALYLGFLSFCIIGAVVDVLWSWLRTWAYYRVEMVGSSTRGQLRCVLDKVFGTLFDDPDDSDEDDKRISAIGHRKFSVVVGSYDHVFFWRVSDGKTITIPGILNLAGRKSASFESDVEKPGVLIIVDNAVHLSDRHLSDLTKVSG